MGTTDILMKAIEGVVRAFKMSGATSVKIDLGKESEVVINGIPKARPITNREWLMSLSDRDFAGHVTGKQCLYKDCAICKYRKGPTCPAKALRDYINWLSAEHKEPNNEQHENS